MNWSYISNSTQWHRCKPRAPMCWARSVAPETLAGVGARPTLATFSRGERSPAAATLRGLGIHEDESLLHQRFLVVEDHAVQVDKRLGIDKNAHIAILEDAVAFARLRVEADVIA